ncbi:hypothetical protein C8Q80DRAFT_1275691 [Daedaleopsis nitida]|nr:hypothetical protein C8Q80DRAFT_1275691 [Daedaleopsis nitida]
MDFQLSPSRAGLEQNSRLLLPVETMTTGCAPQPVNRLPAELLVEIIQIVKAARVDDHVERYSYSFKHNPHCEDSAALLVSLGSVCTLWRLAINTTPLLWRDVHVTSNSSWLELCLHRSAPIPIHVCIHSPEKLPSALVTLSQASHRIQKLIAPRTTLDTVDQLNAFLSPSMHRLTKICINGEDYAGEVRSIGGSIIAQAILPSLHTLKLDFVDLDWSLPSIRRLRVLHLRNSRPAKGHSLSLVQFLRMLETWDALEDLMLDFAFPFDTYSPTGLVRDVSGPTVSLPNIRSIWFESPPARDPSSPDLYHLLSHLVLPASAEVKIYSHVLVEHASSAEGGFVNTIPTEGLPILRTATFAEIWPLGCEIQLGGRPETNLQGVSRGLELQLIPVDRDGAHSEAWWTAAYTPARALSELCTLLGGAPLRQLQIRFLPYPRESWLELFGAFPALTELTVSELVHCGGDAPGGDEFLLDALSFTWTQPDDRLACSSTDTGTSIGTGTGASAKAARARVMLPRLRALHFSYLARGDDATLSNIAGCLRTRAAHGARVAELGLHVEGRPEDFCLDAGAGRRWRLLRVLSTLVDRLVAVAT